MDFPNGCEYVTINGTPAAQMCRKKCGMCKCEEPKTRKTCGDDCDKLDCIVSDWDEEWSECSKPCGGGLKTKSRIILERPTENGKQCPHLGVSADYNTRLKT